jgi:hypothetical protein
LINATLVEVIEIQQPGFDCRHDAEQPPLAFEQ